MWWGVVGGCGGGVVGVQWSCNLGVYGGMLIPARGRVATHEFSARF